MAVSLAVDLRLFGCELVHHSERCLTHCVTCQQLDRIADIDAIAKTPDGIPIFIAWRDQSNGQHDYHTITVRLANERGSRNVQGAKLIDHRSRADIYVQSYRSGVAWAPAAEIRKALSARVLCDNHRPELTGSDGQVFAVICAACCPAVRYVHRDGQVPALQKGQNPDGTWGELGWFTETLYRQWG